MNVQCTICLGSVGPFIVQDDNSPIRTKFPYTSPCGHLYCEDCAIIQFNTDNPSCALCRARCRYDDLTRLHTTFLQPSTPEIKSPSLDDNPILAHCADALGHLKVGESDLTQADHHICQSVSSSSISLRFIVSLFLRAGSHLLQLEETSDDSGHTQV